MLHEQTQKDFDEWNGILVALPIGEPRHSACSRVPRQKEVNCALLRTCRSIYLEANHLTWYNNTFVFTDWVPLGRFSRAIGPVSTALVTKIQLDIFASSALDEHYWDQKIRLMAREMTNLKEVHIFIERFKLRPEPSRSDWENQNLTTSFLPGILDLTRLRLSSMTLVVWDIQEFMFPVNGSTTNTMLACQTFRTTTAEKQAWAREMRRAVLQL
jgi:hypothetical protein